MLYSKEYLSVSHYFHGYSLTLSTGQKPSPGGEGWVRGDLNPPHPSLLPQGEGEISVPR
ncbi:hypothetical protein CRENPOLYSF2_2570005 [Crenothrix polyspora]|uniref:Uncharacterized protein n=1 Tax=Crenothrix polyspora TaxID=360316 RepID=A0A1R4H7M8_9GAMM|nr:hypothetical protein CRENPOLYSF2_2570005 [Crenothrix polyspora]